MAVQLANDEILIKQYDYSEKSVKDGLKKQRLQRKLIVTNKRIISEVEGKKQVSRKEMPIEAADYVDSTFTTQTGSLGGVIASFIFAAIFFALYFVLNKKISWFSYAVIPAIICVVLGVVFLILYFIKRKAAVTLTISGCKTENVLLDVGASSLASNKSKKEITISVDRKTSEEMINEIGAIIIDVKAQNARKKNNF